MVSIAVGCDEAAFELKETLAQHLRDNGYEVRAFGVHSGETADYPDVAVEVAEAVARGEHERAILVCGTGVGMSITANKVPGVRAAQCHDVYSAERARKSNDAAWMESEFQGGRSVLKVEKMEEIDRSYHQSETT